MPDCITDEERQLIDAAVADGAVTHVPTGESGLDSETYYYNGRKLVAKDPDAARRAYTSFGQNSREIDKIKRRREVIKAKFRAGQSITEMVRDMKVSERTVTRDLKHLKLRYRESA